MFGTKFWRITHMPKFMAMWKMLCWILKNKNKKNFHQSWGQDEKKLNIKQSPVISDDRASAVAKSTRMVLKWEYEYSMITRPIQWILMSWLLALPGHHQPWYWLCNQDRSLSSTGKEFNCLHHPSFEKWWQMQIQSSAVITRSNIVRYYINDYRNWGWISTRC